ncbi:MAG: Gfo/Idh/MocA family oxidoreductase [bacterium]|nr:MAG: Gfo/Idh/MocA family oxidoreductase [bacterium]
MISLPIVIHGITGRMGQVALMAVKRIAADKMVVVDGEVISPIPIGIGRNFEKLKIIAHTYNMENYFTDLATALNVAQKINPKSQIYHCTIATGSRKEVMLPALSLMDASSTVIFMEKPLAANYADGFAIVEKLEHANFKHGVVHHMLEAPGVKRALEMIAEIKPLHAQMKFGYEVAPGFSDKEYCCQRPDFNWTLKYAGGGIILDMCHEGYLSEALFGETEYLSAMARLLVPERVSYDRVGTIDCNVEDYAALRREHTNGVVNTSIWSWCRRINSEFGPLEITVEGENGTLVFGLYGLKVQWKETAPLLLWEKSFSDEKIEWRDYWQYIDLTHRDPFAEELAGFIKSIMTGKKYWKNAIHALDILGQVEALYKSAANNGIPIHRDNFFRYPQPASVDWKPERLQGKLKGIIA